VDARRVEEGFEGAPKYGAPLFGARQLLRIFHQLAQETSDHGERLCGGASLGMGARHADRRATGMTRARRHRRHKKRAAGDGLAMPIRLAQSNEDIPPIIEKRVQLRGQAATRQIVRREAAPSPLVLHFKRKYSRHRRDHDRIGRMRMSPDRES